MVSSTIGDKFYSQDHFQAAINITIGECTESYTLVDLACVPNVCTGCRIDLGAVCAGFNDCQCAQGYEGLTCSLVAGFYDSIVLKFRTLPVINSKRSVSVEMRDYLISETQSNFFLFFWSIYVNFY